jgi:bacterioferritin-associated ferredoxin
MFICICNQITDKDLEKVLTKHPNIKANEIIKELGLGSDCGTCLEEIIEDRLKTHNLKVLKKFKI